MKKRSRKSWNEYYSKESVGERDLHDQSIVMCGSGDTVLPLSLSSPN